MIDLPETVAQLVHKLPDGRFFIADQTVCETEGLGRLLARMNNYWTRHERLDGWVAPAPEEFPSVVRAEDMHRECVRDGWIMGEHPVRFLRGNDHE